MANNGTWGSGLELTSMNLTIPVPKIKRKQENQPGVGGEWIESLDPGRCLCWHHIGIRSEEPIAIEVNQVARVFGDPNFGLPGDL